MRQVAREAGNFRNYGTEKGDSLVGRLSCEGIDRAAINGVRGGA